MAGRLIQHLLVFILVYADFAYSHSDYYITPSLNESVCPQQPCLSLSQLSANSSRYLGNETNITLFFLPGNHNLNEELSLSHADNFSMTKDKGGNGTVLIECGSPSGRFNISETTSVTIKNLHFIGCESNRVSQVEKLIVKDTIFQGVEGKSTEIVLTNVTTACIAESMFHSNTRINNYRNTVVLHYGSTIQIGGRALYIVSSNVSIISCKFMNNTVNADIAHTSLNFVSGGALYTTLSNISIVNSTFTNNRAGIGGVLLAHNSSLHVVGSNYSYNTAANYGGVMGISESTVNITNSNFSNNAAEDSGGVMVAYYNNSFSISGTTFANNSASRGGVMDTIESSFTITDSTFSDNAAKFHGGAIFALYSLFSINRNNFTNNSATNGGVIILDNSDHTMTKSLDITNSTFINNSGGGFIVCFQCSTHIVNSEFDHNSGSLYIFNGNLTFSGYTVFENSAEPSKKENSLLQERGGAVTSFLSTVTFTGESILSNNHAQHGGAILAVESTIIMYGSTTVANNMATKYVTNSSGGGISLQQSKLEIKGKCNISDNHATRSGGIHASGSIIAIYQPGTLHLINNRADNGHGGGLYLEVNPKVYTQYYTSDEEKIIFKGNHAIYGGAMYVADDTNSGACLADSDCFIQTLSLNPFGIVQNTMDNNIMLFSGNIASQGANIFGGLLDRCILDPLILVNDSDVNFFYSIGKKIELDTISSLPVRVCFCNIESELDCSYQPPTIKVKKGYAFNVLLVAVDQANHSVDANISSFLSSKEGSIIEGQIQQLVRNCTNLKFNIVSPYDSETLYLFAEGPCGSSRLSTQSLSIEFTNCTCPIGFDPLENRIKRECICTCDSQLSPHVDVTTCNSTTGSFVKVNTGTNSWITPIDSSMYIIYPHCPFDYCKSENVTMNLNLPNRTDEQCANNRTGRLCGACQQNYSLSLGSSRCLECQNHTPAVPVGIFLLAIIAGILLVTALLALNMTVAVGLINGFIFYSNIVAANSAVFFPSSEPSFPTVFIGWLNLDVGIDVCFFDGLDAYYKTWLQLAFPAYIIILVIIIIIVSEYSPRFAGLIGKRDPIATLVTLILLSYAKLLSVSITALLPAIINYPNGSLEIVWLPDGNEKYFLGKHAALVIVAIIIILIGIPYTSILFLWQWIVCAPKWKIFRWTRNTKLNTFVFAHHAPYNAKYRYWTGLLLLVRVVLFTIALGTKSIEPEVSLSVTLILVGGLLSLKTIGITVYKSLLVDVMETILYFNLLAFATFSSFHFKADMKKQKIVAHISTAVTFILLVGAIIYHVFLLVRKDKHPKEEDGVVLVPVQPANAEVTHSVIEIPRPCVESPPPQANSNEATVTY